MTSFSFTTISTGEPSPLGKCSPSFSSPTTESVLVVNASVLANPSALRVNEKPAKIVSRSAVEIQIRFGFFSTAAPIFDQAPLNCSSTSSKRGTFGQKIQRPKTTRRAGKNVRTVIIADAIPIAPTGPKPLFPDNWLSRSTNRPAITVDPEARIGSTTPRNAIFIASYLDS